MNAPTTGLNLITQNIVRNHQVLSTLALRKVIVEQLVSGRCPWQMEPQRQVLSLYPWDDSWLPDSFRAYHNLIDHEWYVTLRLLIH
jgi:hypothetical protein